MNGINSIPVNSLPAHLTSSRSSSAVSNALAAATAAAAALGNNSIMTSSQSIYLPNNHNQQQQFLNAKFDNDNRQMVYKYIGDLLILELRENALIELCKHRESMPNMALLLWHTFGVVPALVQEVCSIYPFMNPPSLSVHQSNRVCNALALLQCLASHPETRAAFLEACIPSYLYNFLQSQSRTKQYEYLRLTSLGVIGALVKSDDPDVISFLLNTEMIPLCLKIMETGSELSKTVATFILQKILNDKHGLNYMCDKVERLEQVNIMLTHVVMSLTVEFSQRLLKHVVRCYSRLADSPIACDTLRNCLPPQLFDKEIASCLANDPPSLQMLEKIHKNYDPPNNHLLSSSSLSGGGGGGGAAAGLSNSQHYSSSMINNLSRVASAPRTLMNLASNANHSSNNNTAATNGNGPGCYAP